MMREDVISHMLPAGRYYTGDPCYVFSDEDWDELLKQTNCLAHEGIVEFKGRKMAIFSTAYGDGEFTDIHGNVYGVDSGLLAAVPMEIISRKPIDGRIIESEREIPCSNDRGYISFGFGGIDTNFHMEQGEAQ